MHMKQSPYQLHPQQFLSSSSSFYIMLHMCDVRTEAPQCEQCGPQGGPQSKGVAAPGVALQNS